MCKRVNANDSSKLAKKTDYNNRITEIQEKITSITGLAATVALNAVKNEISNVSDLLKDLEVFYCLWL